MNIKIKPIEKDIYEFVTETKVTYSLSLLEEELKNLEIINEELTEFNEWRETLPEIRKQYIEEKFTIPTDETQGKIDLINSIK